MQYQQIEEKIKQLNDREDRLKGLIDQLVSGIKSLRELLYETMIEKDKWQKEYPSVIDPVLMLNKSIDESRSQIKKLNDKKKSLHAKIGRVRSERVALGGSLNR